MYDALDTNNVTLAHNDAEEATVPSYTKPQPRLPTREDPGRLALMYEDTTCAAAPHAADNVIKP